MIRSTTDFARHVGLARTTVSRVLNGQPGLKQKTIDRVRRAIDETGFTPNAYALHLKGKGTATVGICVETLMTPPAVLKLATLQRLLRERNYASLIEVLAPDGSRTVVRHFLSMRVDAVVFIGHFAEAELSQRIHELSGHGVPHLVIDHAGIAGANTVALDRRRAMAEMTRHLLTLGHRRFGLLGLSSDLRSVQDRRAGVADALTAAGLALDRHTVSLDHLHVRTHDFEFGRALAASFLAQPAPPTAWVALNDEIAIGAIHGAQDAGLRVPADVSVSGFNNQDLCRMSRPTLTSVDQQIPQTIEAAAALLLGQIGQPLRRRTRALSIAPLLVPRESTGPARAAAGSVGRRHSSPGS